MRSPGKNLWRCPGASSQEITTSCHVATSSLTTMSNDLETGVVTNHPFPVLTWQRNIVLLSLLTQVLAAEDRPLPYHQQIWVNISSIIPIIPRCVWLYRTLVLSNSHTRSHTYTYIITIFSLDPGGGSCYWLVSFPLTKRINVNGRLSQMYFIVRW